MLEKNVDGRLPVKTKENVSVSNGWRVGLRGYRCSRRLKNKHAGENVWKVGAQKKKDRQTLKRIHIA